MRKLMCVLTIGFIIGTLTMGTALALTIDIMEYGAGNITVTASGSPPPSSLATVVGTETAVSIGFTGGELGSVFQLGLVNLYKDAAQTKLSDQLLLFRTPDIFMLPASVSFLFRSDDEAGNLVPFPALPSGISAVIRAAIQDAIAADINSLQVLAKVTENGGLQQVYDKDGLTIRVQSDIVATPEPSATVLLGLSLFSLGFLARKKLPAKG